MIRNITFRCVQYGKEDLAIYHFRKYYKDMTPSEKEVLLYSAMRKDMVSLIELYFELHGTVSVDIDLALTITASRSAIGALQFILDRLENSSNYEIERRIFREAIKYKQMEVVSYMIKRCTSSQFKNLCLIYGQEFVEEAIRTKHLDTYLNTVCIFFAHDHIKNHHRKFIEQCARNGAADIMNHILIHTSEEERHYIDMNQIYTIANDVSVLIYIDSAFIINTWNKYQAYMCAVGNQNKKIITYLDSRYEGIKNQHTNPQKVMEMALLNNDEGLLRYYDDMDITIDLERDNYKILIDSFKNGPNAARYLIKKYNVDIRPFQKEILLVSLQENNIKSLEFILRTIKHVIPLGEEFYDIASDEAIELVNKHFITLSHAETKLYVCPTCKKTNTRDSVFIQPCGHQFHIYCLYQNMNGETGNYTCNKCSSVIHGCRTRFMHFFKRSIPLL